MNVERLYRRLPPTLQTALLNLKALELHRERYGVKFERMAKLWAPNERRSVDELREMQDREVASLVRHAMENVPFYSRRYGELGLVPEDIRGVDDLHLLPILSKDDVRAGTDALTSRTANRRRLRHGHTSGTTGSPLDVLYDIPVCVAHHVTDWRQKRWGGMRRGDPYASLQGRMIVPIETARPPFWRMNHVHRQLFLSAFHLHANHLPHYISHLRESGIEWLEGYPSTIVILAAWLREQGETLRMSGVFTSSETLHDWQRETIEQAFACEVYDSLGMAERVLFAAECEAHEGRHLAEDYGVTELLGDDWTAVTPGEPGRVVATGLVNRAFPLIRYHTGDISSELTGGCACGRTFRRLSGVMTKQEALISLPDGRLVSPSVLTHPFKPMNRVAASQIVQDSLHSIRIRVVRREGWSNDDERQLHAGLRDRLGNEVELFIEYVDSVAPEPGKKFRWVVSAVRPSLGGAPR